MEDHIFLKRVYKLKLNCADKVISLKHLYTNQSRKAESCILKYMIIHRKYYTYTNTLPSKQIEQCVRKGIKSVPAVTNLRLYCMRLCARPLGFFFLSCLATLGVCPLTLPARASEPWTLPTMNKSKDRNQSTFNNNSTCQLVDIAYINFNREARFILLSNNLSYSKKNFQWNCNQESPELTHGWFLRRRC